MIQKMRWFDVPLGENCFGKVNKNTQLPKGTQHHRYKLLAIFKGFRKHLVDAEPDMTDIRLVV